MIRPLVGYSCDMAVSYAHTWKRGRRPLDVGHRGMGVSYASKQYVPLVARTARASPPARTALGRLHKRSRTSPSRLTYALSLCRAVQLNSQCRKPGAALGGRNRHAFRDVHTRRSSVSDPNDLAHCGKWGRNGWELNVVFSRCVCRRVYKRGHLYVPRASRDCLMLQLLDVACSARRVLTAV